MKKGKSEMSIFRDVLKMIQEDEDAFNEICKNDLDGFVDTMLYILESKYYFYKIVESIRELYNMYMENRYYVENSQKRYRVKKEFHDFNDLNGEIRKKFINIYGEGKITASEMENYYIFEYGVNDLKAVKKLMNLLANINHETKSDFINRCKTINKWNYSYYKWHELYDCIYNFFDLHDFLNNINYGTEFIISSINQLKEFIGMIHNTNCKH